MKTANTQFGDVYQDLEIRISAPLSADEYPVELSLRGLHDSQGVLKIDLNGLKAAVLDPTIYGQALGAALFGKDGIGIRISRGRSGC